MCDSAETIERRASAVREAASVLRAVPIEQRAQWLAKSADQLLHQVDQQGTALARSSGLSPPMVSWAAKTTLRTIEQKGLAALAARAEDPRATPIAMLAVILAGNVFTACIRASVVPLLLGVPVLLKSSSRETLFPAMLADALRRVNPQLGAALDVVTFEGGDPESEAALVEAAEAVAVYGSDQTVASIGKRSGGREVIGHGHGVSAAYCAREALAEAHIEDTVKNLALDIGAYDQRGCLSPQVVYVQADERCPALAFAHRLAAEGLEPLGQKLPRGPLPPSVGAVQAQWRGLAEVESTLITGPSYAICIRPGGLPRWSPGYRNVTVMPVESAAEALKLMEPFATSLKCLGTDDPSRADVESRLARSDSLRAYVCNLGRMQTPPLDAPADGRPVWHGLLRRQTPMKRR
jgi:hypothetical protein